MTIQRKIRHVLSSEGEGQLFRYLPKLGLPFDLTKPITITEKVDGSTMQVNQGMPFKRYDLFKKGDPRKHTATEEERYELRHCSRENPSEKFYLDAFDTVDWSRVPADVWVYFEAMGPRIGARYRDGQPCVRVFDTSDADGFRNFEATKRIAEAAGLPLIANREVVFGDLTTLLWMISSAVSEDPLLPKHELEGWVLRQDDLVGKIRCADMGKLSP